jgi:hypothetical protein
VYSRADGTGALTADSFELIFNSNGGGATAASIGSVTDSNGDPLAGGETTVRVHLTLTGTPTGVETIELKPASSNAIYDVAGNPASTDETSGELTLTEQVPPVMTGAVLNSDTQITVTLSEDVTGTDRLDDGGFAVAEQGNAGITYPVTAISRGDTASEVILTVPDVGISAKEGLTVTYTAGGNGTIADLAGNAMLTDPVGVDIPAWDTTSPTIISAAVHPQNAYVDVTFSEGIYANEDGTGAPAADDFILTMTVNGGASSVTIQDVRQPDGETIDDASPLTGGETVIRIFLTVTGTANGQEKITIQPASATSLFDRAGNAMDEQTSTGELSLADRRTPVYDTGGNGHNDPDDSTNEGIGLIIGGEVLEGLVRVIVTDEEDRKVTTISLDEEKLTSTLSSIETGEKLMIAGTNESDTVIIELNARTIQSAEDKALVLEVVTETATYTLPASQIKLDAITARFGGDVPLEDIIIHIELTMISEAQLLIDPTGVIQVIAPIIEFNIKAAYGDTVVEVDRFGAYVQRAIAIPDDVDSSKVTGVLVLDNGTLRHVPTRVAIIDGKTYAIISSLTNSKYTVILYNRTFSDIEDHWAQQAIENMASRLIVNGVAPDRFNPNGEITRAEFATIIANALGLHWTDRSHAFQDVKPGSWYEEAVQTAAAYGLITGYEDGTFRPNQLITRQEAMAIIARAMSLTQLDDQLTSTEASTLLSPFADSSDIAAWAMKAAALNIKYGIIQGYNGKVNPLQPITRAETVIIVDRLLKQAGLIDE